MNGVPFDVSRAGALVYRVGGSLPSLASLKLSLVDRAGRALRVTKCKTVDLEIPADAEIPTDEAPAPASTPTPAPAPETATATPTPEAVR